MLSVLCLASKLDKISKQWLILTQTWRWFWIYLYTEGPLLLNCIKL